MTMFESRLLTKLAATASVIGHIAIVVVILLSAGVRPFQTDSATALTADLVTPDEIEHPEEAAKPPQPEPPLPDLKPSVETPRPLEPQSSPPQQQAAPQPAQRQPAPEQQHANAPQAAAQQS